MALAPKKKSSAAGEDVNPERRLSIVDRTSVNRLLKHAGDAWINTTPNLGDDPATLETSVAITYSNFQAGEEKKIPGTWSRRGI